MRRNLRRNNSQRKHCSLQVRTAEKMGMNLAVIMTVYTVVMRIVMAIIMMKMVSIMMMMRMEMIVKK